MNLIFRWFCSRTVRHAVDMRKHVQRLLNAQRDILAPQAVEALTPAIQQLHAAIHAGVDTAALVAQMRQLEHVANQNLKAHPHASIRENVEVLLVAVAVALAVRTFFLQPMKIPTGSMQPTLYGITQTNLKDKPEATIPNGFVRFFEACFYGAFYYHVAAQTEGAWEMAEPAKTVFPFVKRQRFRVGATDYTLWFPPERLPIERDKVYRPGEDILKLREIAGDHLFVNRLTYNFRRPQRGDIIIFETRGIQGLQQDTFYIKRLVALGGEKVQIGNDQRLIIDGQRLDASTPHFENLYSFKPTYSENHYFGHVNEAVGNAIGRPGIAPLFPDEKNPPFVVATNHCLVMGDNTMNSFDSRYWGDFPREKVIGKSGFVYWPISSRFGWGYR